MHVRFLPPRNPGDAALRAMTQTARDHLQDELDAWFLSMWVIFGMTFVVAWIGMMIGILAMVLS